MSFFNDTSVCQSAANPLNKIIDVSTKTNISNFRPENIVNETPNIHQYKNLDNTVQNDFYQFIESSQSNPQPFIIPQEITSGVVLANNHIGQETLINAQQDWSKDFMNLNLQDNRERLSFQPHHTFQTQAVNRDSNFETFHFKSPHESLRSITHLSLNNSNILQNKENIASHEQMNKQVQELDSDFDAVFKELEHEITTDTQKVEENDDDDQHSLKEALSSTRQTEIENSFENDDKSKFADLARSVFDLMNNTPKGVSLNTSNKFKQSGFMQLMNKISTREIEISNDNKKFVDQDGTDIRSVIDDPLKTLGTKDELLQTPFDAALKVSQNVDSNAWQGDFI